MSTQTDCTAEMNALRSQLEVKSVELWEAQCAAKAAIKDRDAAVRERDAALLAQQRAEEQRDALAKELAALRRSRDEAIARLQVPAHTGW